MYFASAAPPVRYPNVYGIDMPSAEELIAHDRTEEEICELIGADWLVYQDLEDLVASSVEGNPEVSTYDCSVFTGEYVTGDVTKDYLAKLDTARRDNNKSDLDDAAVMGLHNDDADSL